jgi:hypothetical protein
MAEEMVVMKKFDCNSPNLNRGGWLMTATRWSGGTFAGYQRTPGVHTVLVVLRVLCREYV